MGKFAIIGLGNFGSNVARVLFEQGHEVICLDQDDDLIKEAQKFSSFCLVGKAADPDIITALNVPGLDAVFVSLGDEISASILVTLHLRDMGAKRIIVKIVSEDHGRILRKVGAHEIIFPERDMAIRVANYVNAPTIVNYLDLTPEYSIQEVVPPDKFIGRTLAETRLRQDYGVNVIGISDVLTGKINLNPGADFVIKESDVLVVIGRRDNLAKLARKE